MHIFPLGWDEEERGQPQHFGKGDFFPYKGIIFIVFLHSVWEGAGGVRDVFPDISSKLFLSLVTNAPAKHSSTRPRFPSVSLIF